MAWRAGFLGALGLSSLVVSAVPSVRGEAGRDVPDAELRQRVQKRVEQWLQEDESRLRREIRKILEESLGPGADAPPAIEAPSGTPAHLGVTTEALDEARREALDLADDEGVRIVSVQPGSPAERAGLSPDDVVLRVNRRRVGSPEQFRSVVRSHRPGDAVNLMVVREGQPRRVRVTLGFPPAEGPAAGDDVRRKALRDDLRGFLESNEKDRPGPASPPSVAAGAPDFDADLFLDDLFAGAKKGTPIGDLLEPVRSDPAGEIILAFLREELRNNIPLLRQHAEPGPEGRWRLRKESVEFFRAWLEDELDQDRKRAEREKRADLPSPAPAKPAARPPRVRLGLFVRDLEPAERSASGVAEGAGFVVNRLVPEGPAMRAGLRPGDVVVKIDGRPATEALLQETLAKARPGDAVNFTVVRAARGDAPGATLDVKVGAEGVRDLSEPRAPKGPGTK